MFDKQITVLNSYVENNTTKYKKTIVKGFFSGSDGMVLNGTMLKKENQYICRILLKDMDNFAIPYNFEIDHSGSKWTLREGDYIVGANVSETVSSIKDIIKKYPVMKITNVSRKDFGSSDMQHYEITGE